MFECLKSIPANKVPYREHALSESGNSMSKMKPRIAKLSKGESWKFARA